MPDPNDIVGHKTFDTGEVCPETGFPKLRHEPVTRAEADRWLAAAERERAARAEQMPDEAAALRVMHEAFVRLTELGWRAAMHAPRDGTRLRLVEAGSTGIHDGYRDSEGRFWILDSDMWPSDPVLFRLYPEDQAKADVRMAEARERFRAIWAQESKDA